LSGIGGVALTLRYNMNLTELDSTEIDAMRCCVWSRAEWRQDPDARGRGLGRLEACCGVPEALQNAHLGHHSPGGLGFAEIC